MEGTRFLCQVDDLGRANVFEQVLHIAQRLQPGEAAQPVIQMGERGRFGGLLDSIEGRERGRHLLLKQVRERLLLLLRESGEDGLIHASIHQRVNTPGHAIQRAKGGQLAVL